MIKDGYFITESARTRFKIWLFKNKTTVNRFSKGCGCSRQFIERVLAGKAKITATVKEHFKKGGYDLL